MAIDFEFDLGSERDAFKQFLYRWWKQRSHRWQERTAPDPWAWVDREVAAMQKGKRTKGYYERMAEKVDYVSPLAMEMELLWEDARNERKAQLDGWFGSSFKRLEGYGPADGLKRWAMIAAEKGEMSVYEIGGMVHRQLLAVQAKAQQEWVSRETQKRLAEEARQASVELVQRKAIAQRRAKGEL
jgi:hypothetical protein